MPLCRDLSAGEFLTIKRSSIASGYIITSVLQQIAIIAVRGRELCR
jgi:hypothetical protein